MKHQTKIRVRFSDTDMNGHVNNAVYASYMEESRVQFFREVYPSATSGVILASLHIDYKAQTKFPEHENVVATTWISRIGKTSFDFFCEIRTEFGELLCNGTAVIVCFDYEAGRSMPIPTNIRSKLEAYFHEVIPERL